MIVRSEIVGRATLYLGDAYAILPTLGWFDVVCTDPPYAFETSGGGKFRAARRHTDQIACEDLDQGFDHLIINPLRSEEHTSELQSLMRISYAVFCLKKK